MTLYVDITYDELCELADEWWFDAESGTVTITNYRQYHGEPTDPDEYSQL